MKLSARGCRDMPGLCHCRRAARGFYYQRPATKRGQKPNEKHPCCSMACLDAQHRVDGMIDPTVHEIAAIDAASGPAGEYIESLGRTDMASWSKDEWMCFLECVVTAYTDELRKLTSNEVPF